MRTIKFRGSDSNGKWHYGDLVHSAQGEFVRIHDYGTNGFYKWFSDVVPESIGQFTGLHDKNGKEIYEGDIIRHKDMVKPYHVIYDGHQFTPNDGFRSLSYPKHWEVIGNIHDNPELMKGGKK